MDKPGPGGRLLKLLCINDDGVREMRDLGVDRNGEPTSQRQAVNRMLDEHVWIGDQKYHAFALAEPPSKAWDNDRFDDVVLKDRTGKWVMPSTEWLEARKRRVAERASEHEVQENRARMLASQNLASQLEQLAARSAPAHQKGAR
jgi:hypothetical protein